MLLSSLICFVSFEGLLKLRSSTIRLEPQVVDNFFTICFISFEAERSISPATRPSAPGVRPSVRSLLALRASLAAKPVQPPSMPAPHSLVRTPQSLVRLSLFIYLNTKLFVFIICICCISQCSLPPCPRHSLASGVRSL